MALIMISFPVPSSVLSLKAIRNDDGSVTIKWEVPAAKGGPDLRYFIVINGKPGFFSKGSNYSITQQEKKQEYKISVSMARLVLKYHQHFYYYSYLFLLSATMLSPLL